MDAHVSDGTCEHLQVSASKKWLTLAELTYNRQLKLAHFRKYARYTQRIIIIIQSVKSRLATVCPQFLRKSIVNTRPGQWHLTWQCRLQRHCTPSQCADCHCVCESVCLQPHCTPCLMPVTVTDTVTGPWTGGTQ